MLCLVTEWSIIRQIRLHIWIDVQAVRGIHPQIIHTNFAVAIATSPVLWVHTTSLCPYDVTWCGGCVREGCLPSPVTRTVQLTEVVTNPPLEKLENYGELQALQCQVIPVQLGQWLQLRDWTQGMMDTASWSFLACCCCSVCLTELNCLARLKTIICLYVLLLLSSHFLFKRKNAGFQNICQLKMPNKLLSAGCVHLYESGPFLLKFMGVYKSWRAMHIHAL